MLYEIDKIAFDPTEPDVIPKKPETALLIVGRSTRQNSNAIINESGLQNIQTQGDNSCRARIVFAKLLENAYNENKWRSMHYYTGTFTSYDDVAEQMIQMRLIYSDVRLRCYRIPTAKYLKQMERMNTLLNNLTRTKTRLVKLRSQFDMCLRLDSCLAATAKDIEFAQGLSQLKKALEAERAYTRRKICQIFEALDLTVYRQQVGI
jgi:hypothetical protein